MAQPTTSPKIEELRFRLKTDPKSRMFYPLAEELRKIGQFDEAEKVLRSGLESHTTYLSGWVSLGRVLRDQKKDGEAVDALSRALQLDPGNVVAARLLADAYLALGEKVEAIKKYKLVHALLPSDQDLAALIGRLDDEIKHADGPEQEPESLASATAEDLAPASVAAVAEDAPLSVDIAPAPLAAPADESPFASAAAEESPFGLDDPERLPEPLTSPVFDSRNAQQNSPFASSRVADDETNPWTRGGNALSAAFAAQQEEHRVEEATGDVEPMSAAHDESPFETPAADSGYTSEAFSIEQPQGMHLSRAPLAADVPADLVEDADLPLPEAAVVASEPLLETLPESDTADVFGYEAAAPEPFPAGDDAIATVDAEDFTNTLTMADLYARQGLTDDARHIYENILARDPENTEVRARLDALLAPRSAAAAIPEHAADLMAAPAMISVASSKAAKIARLESWLARVGRREVSGV